MSFRTWMGAAALALVFAACGGGDEDNAPPTCADGEILCDGACADTATDPRNCGDCGIACAEGEICAEGECALACPEGQTACDGTCHSLLNSNDHCGACGNACAEGESCVNGVCEISCPVGQALCDGTCQDLNRSPAHCGACGRACIPGNVCVDGFCRAECPAGQSACGGGCHDLETSHDHCGRCGNACAEGEVCVDGSCTDGCPAGMQLCGGECRPIATDRANCGGCGRACGNDELCIDGACEVACAGGLTACDDTCVDTEWDRANCGGCGNACENGETCDQGVCRPVCSGFNDTICDGACTNTDYDPDNCGACGNECAPGQVCSEGVCTAFCAGGTATCDGQCTSLADDPENCGACGNVCSVGDNVVGYCSRGRCVTTCATGYGDCDGDPANGCESRFATDPEDCGACGNVCPVPPNGVAACLGGVCSVGGCEPGWGNCDLQADNGCEEHLATSSQHCGACNNACTGGFICIAGTCQDPGPGESCTDPFVLQPGLNTVYRTPATNDHFTAAPSCDASTPTGGDLVLRYDATFDGEVDVTLLDKPANNRWHMVVSDQPCGTMTELACGSASAGTRVTASFPVTNGSSYYIYVVDTDSGTAPLNSPLAVRLNAYQCGSFTGHVVSHAPAAGATDVGDLLEVVFDAPISRTAGTIQLTGDKGTSATIPIDSAQVTFAADGQSISIAPSVTFQQGETITVSWSGIVDEVCGAPIAAPAGWTFTTPAPPCIPGQNGMVGDSITRIPVPNQGGTFTEYWVAADDEPNGWVYIGYISSLYRARKDGSAFERLHGVHVNQYLLGYDMIFVGDDIYMLTDETTADRPLLHRLSRDKGVTFTQELIAARSPSMTSSARGSGLAVDGNRLYVLIRATSTTTDTQIWSVKTTGTLPAVPELVHAFQGYRYCQGLVMDASYFYTTCASSASTTSGPVIRIDRATGTITELATFETSTTNAAIHGKDIDGDGLFDVLYRNDDNESADFVCNPAGTPYAGQLYSFGTGTSNFGLGFDPVHNVLWAWDDDTQVLIRVE